jgi:PST family polysaccharide transporter
MPNESPSTHCVCRPNRLLSCSTKTEEDERNEKHIRTEHLLPNLRQRTVPGALVTIVGQGAQFLLNLVSTMVLARLLTPTDFGLFAMVTTITSLLFVFHCYGAARGYNPALPRSC